MPILSGDIKRNIIVSKTVSGMINARARLFKTLNVFLTGTITRNIDRAKSYGSELSFSGVVDGIKRHGYDAVLSLEGAVTYLYEKLNIPSGVLLLNGAVTYAYDFLGSTLGSVVDIYGLVTKRLSLGRLKDGVLDMAGTIYYAVAELFTSSKSGSLTLSGDIRTGRGKSTSGGLFGGGGDTGFVFDKGGDFTFADTSDYIWGSSIGIVTWVLTQLRLYPGVITPTGIARRWLQGSGSKTGEITPSATLNRRLNLLRQPSGVLDFSGAASRPNQGTDSDRLGYMTLNGLPSRLVSKWRNYVSDINLSGLVSASKIGLIWGSYAGQLDLAALLSSQIQKSKDLPIQIISFIASVYRFLVLARTKAGALDLAGVASWVLADRLGTVRGVLDLVGLVSRSSVLERAKDSILSFAGEAIAYMGVITFTKPLGELSIAGSVSRIIDVTHTQLGALALAGVSNRQADLNRNDSGSLTFKGDWDEWREALYYGPEI